jgi:hypothetical protein
MDCVIDDLISGVLDFQAIRSVEPKLKLDVRNLTHAFAIKVLLGSLMTKSVE